MSTIRARIDAAFELLGRTLYQNRLKTLLIMALLVAALLSQLPNMTRDTSNEGYFHPDDPVLLSYNDFREQFGREDMIVIAVNPPNVFDRSFLKTLRTFHEALEQEVPYLDEVTSLINVRNTRGEGDELIVEDLLEKLPETPEAMAEFKERVLSSKLYPNLYISEDGRFTTVLIETLAFSSKGTEEDVLAGFEDDAGFVPGESGSAASLPLTEEENSEVVRAAERVVSRFDKPDFSLRMAGPPVNTDFFNTAIQRDVATFMTLSFIVFSAFLFILFRRIAGVVLPLLVVFLGMLSSVSLMAIFDAPMTTVTTILPSFLTAVGIGSSVHVLAVFFRRFQQNGNKEDAVVYALGHSGLPVLMTGLTTAAGLLSFSTSGLAPVADLGIFGGLGVMVILVYTIIMLPALLALWPLRQHVRIGGAKLTGRMDRLLTGIADFATSHARGVVIIAAALITVFALGLIGLEFSHNYVKWFPRSSDVRKSIELIDGELKGFTTVEAVVDTGRENGLYDPHIMNQIDALGRFAQGYQDRTDGTLVGKTVSVLNVLQETNQALNENRQEFYAVPQNRELIAQELLLFENSGSDDLEKMVDSQFRKARLTMKVIRVDAAAYFQFITAVANKAKDLFHDNEETVVVTGIASLFSRIMHLSLESMARSYVIAGIVITVMMILLLGSVRFGLISMAPNLAPIVVTMGMMGWIGIPLDMSNMLLGTIAIGLAVDDTIHFFHNFRRYYIQNRNTAEAVRQTMLTTGRAMVFTTIVLVTGFWLFLFASLVNLIHFGLLIGVTLIIALLADILLAPAIMALITGTKRGSRMMERWGGKTSD